MQRLSLVIAALFLISAPATAQDPTPIPADVQKHMKSMVGMWTFEGTEGKRKFSGEERIRLTKSKAAVIQEGHFELKDGKKENYVIVSGWDGSKKTVLVRGFTSDGLSWSGEWKKLSNGKWQGTASGGAATFEVKEDSMRYEEAGNGTPWISEFTRKKKKSKGAAPK